MTVTAHLSARYPLNIAGMPQYESKVEQMLNELLDTRSELAIIEIKTSALKKKRQELAVDLVENGYTKYRVAKMLDVTPTAIANWVKDREESQKRSNFSTDGDQSETK